MHLSLGLIAAVLAVNVIASEEPRMHKVTRPSRRSPFEELHPQQDQEPKCFTCQQIGNDIVTSSSFYKAVTSYTSISSIQSNGLVFPPLAQYVPQAQFNNWQGCTSIWAGAAEAFLAYGAAIQLQQFTLQIMIQSFTQIMAVLTTLVQGLQAVAQSGPIGSFLNPFSSAIALVLQALQGYFAFTTTIFSFEQFVSGCGGIWQQFNQMMAFLVQWGYQEQIWQTDCLQQYGVSLSTFQSAYQVTSISQYYYVETFSSQTLSGSTYIGGGNPTCPGAQVASSGFIPQLGQGVGIEKILSISKSGGLLQGEHGLLGSLSSAPTKGGSGHGLLKPVKGLLGGLLG